MEPVEAALARIQARTLAISIDSDVLFPPPEQELIARHIPGARYARIDSTYGHDGFLIEGDALTVTIAPFIAPPQRATAS